MATAQVTPIPELYHHSDLGAYECMGCREMIEVPKRAYLKQGAAKPERLDNPENLMIWLEMHQLDHAECSSYLDAKLARNARLFRKEKARRGLLARAGR